MSSDAKMDYRREAVAAMKMAIDASGFERVKWVRLAQAWQDMARWQDVAGEREGRDAAAPSPSVVRADHD